MYKLFFLSLCIFLLGCNKKKFFDGPHHYSDDFESYSTYTELLPSDDTRWSFTQLTYDDNTISIDTSIVHGGTKSLKFIASPTVNGLLSKCSIAKQNMAFCEGGTVQASIWYYIEGTGPLGWTFFLDLEEQTAIGAGPGMRVAMDQKQDIVLEYKLKDGQTDQTGNPLKFPRNQWFKITLETKLSKKKKGWVKLYLDEKLIIQDENTRTLPVDELYYQQGTKGMYSSIEIGVTANPNNAPVILYADDFSIHLMQ